MLRISVRDWWQFGNLSAATICGTGLAHETNAIVALGAATLLSSAASLFPSKDARGIARQARGLVRDTAQDAVNEPGSRGGFDVGEALNGLTISRLWTGQAVALPLIVASLEGVGGVGLNPTRASIGALTWVVIGTGFGHWRRGAEAAKLAELRTLVKTVNTDRGITA